MLYFAAHRVNTLAKFGPAKSRGFTLVELMITVAIIAILAAVAMPNYTAWIANAKVRTATESINTGLQKARVEAIRSNTTVRFILSADSAWCITLVVNATDCIGAIESRSAMEGSSDITTTAIVPPSTTLASFTQLIVSFTNMGTVNASPVAFSELNLTNSKLTTDKRDLRIVMGTGGISRACDPYTGLSATDPRRC